MISSPLMMPVLRGESTAEYTTIYWTEVRRELDGTDCQWRHNLEFLYYATIYNIDEGGAIRHVHLKLMLLLLK